MDDTNPPVQFFDLEGVPARWERGKYPKRIDHKGEEVTVYDLEKFFQAAQPITEAEFDDLVASYTKKDR